MNYDLITIIIVAGVAAVAFLPTIPLMLLPFVRRLRGWAKAGMWIFACGVYLLNAALVACWAGDVIQNRGETSPLSRFTDISSCIYLRRYSTRCFSASGSDR